MKLRLEAAYAALSATIACVASLLVLRPWRSPVDAPYSYAGDATLNQAWIKGILEHGWYWRNPDLGAPFGQQNFDFPALHGDLLNVLLVKLLGAFTGDASVVMNLFFLITFPLVALSAYLVLRLFRVSAPAATVCSCLYALLPYHFARGEGHLFLSAYYAVPLGAYLILAVLDDRPLFSRRSGQRRGSLLSYASSRTLTTLGLCLVVSLASAAFYYSAFTVLLVATAALLRSVVTRSVRPVAQGGAVVGAITVFSVLVFAPSLVYWVEHGRNQQVAHRYAFESELYGLKFTQLVLPMEFHRVDKLARARQEYDRWSAPRTEASSSATLGIVAASGFLWLLAVSFLQLAGPGRLRVSPKYLHAALATLIALFFAWTGGFATIVAGVAPQIRAWNRLSIFIGFFALLGVGLLLDSLRGRRLLYWAALPAVVILGILDQTSPAFTPQRSVANEWRNDEAFVHAIDQRLPEGAMIYQLPYAAFPEVHPPGQMIDYDSLRGYLHSRDLRWSFGAIRNRPENRAGLLGTMPVPQFLPIVSSLGFQGVWVDRFGYDDRGTQVERELARLAGPPALVSANGRFAFYDLRSFKAS